MIAPSMLPPNRGKKTDDLDAIRLAKLLRAGLLTKVYVNDEETEALRALTRAREDAVQAQQKARGALRNFLVHQGLRYEGKSSWTKEHYRWINSQKFAHPALEIVRDDNVREAQGAEARIVRLTKDIQLLAAQSRHAPMIAALQGLRGVQLITAATLAFEIGSFGRFEKAKHLMSYLGLVPSEHSSGERVAKGSITKAGNAHIRRVLCEAAWSYQYGGTGTEIIKRRAHVSAAVRAISEKAQERLHGRYLSMVRRKKELNKVNVAISRELAGFIWAIGREVEKSAASPA
jgi:transposase